MSSLKAIVQELYAAHGPGKPMGAAELDPKKPHFFLHRRFLGDHDLLVIFNAKRCQYNCAFCELPTKSSRVLIPAGDIISQFEFVVRELKHSLSVLNRLTFSNEGSVLDTDTFPADALDSLVDASTELKLVNRLVLETRLEFLDLARLRCLRSMAPKLTFDILTGFETQDQRIRDDVLRKREPLSAFQEGLDRVAAGGADLTTYVLFKPDPTMTDTAALQEATASIEYIRAECNRRNISLTIRINPMYMTSGSPWAMQAAGNPEYQPPRLTDVMRTAAKARQAGARIYIGLSTEGLDASGGTYHVREDYSPKLIKPIKMFNDGLLSSFDGIV